MSKFAEKLKEEVEALIPPLIYFLVTLHGGALVFSDDPALPLPERVAAFERALVKDALLRAKNKQREAAELLGMSYDQFRHLYRKYGMKDGGLA